jgi:hypothetical protein
MEGVKPSKIYVYFKNIYIFIYLFIYVTTYVNITMYSPVQISYANKERKKKEYDH